MSLPDETLQHLAYWCRAQYADDTKAYDLYCEVLDGIRDNDAVLDGDPDWPTVLRRVRAGSR